MSRRVALPPAADEVRELDFSHDNRKDDVLICPDDDVPLRDVGGSWKFSRCPRCGLTAKQLGLV